MLLTQLILDFGCRFTSAHELQGYMYKRESVGMAAATTRDALSSQNPYLVLGAPGDLDVWKQIDAYDDQGLTHDLQRLKYTMQNEFDYQQMAWWISDRTISLYTDNFQEQRYRHGDECLKRVLQHMHKQKRLKDDTRNVVEMSIQFLKQQSFHDLRNDQDGVS